MGLSGKNSFNKNWRFDAFVCFLFGWILAGLLVPGFAFAHAGLTNSAPQNGASMDAPPEKIMLRFGEVVQLISAKLLSDGKLGDGDTDTELVLKADEGKKSQTFNFPLSLPQDAANYLIVARIVSKDGHPISVSIPFGVGKPAQAGGEVAALAARSSGTFYSSARNFFRFLYYFFALFISGMIFNVSLFAKALNTHGSQFDHKTYLNYLKFLLGGAALALGFYTLFTLLDFAGADGFAKMDLALSIFAGSSELWRVLVGGLGVALGVIVLVMRSQSLALQLAVAFALIGSFVVSGHVYSMNSVFFTLLLFVHLVGASFWIGSLPVILRILTKAEAQHQLTYIHQFSNVVPISLLAIFATGVTLLDRLIPSLDALVSWSYGQLLLAKLALVAGFALIGLLNKVALYDKSFTLFPPATPAFPGAYPGVNRGDSAFKSSPLRLFVNAIRIDHLLAVGIIFLSASLAVNGPEKHGKMGGKMAGDMTGKQTAAMPNATEKNERLTLGEAIKIEINKPQPTRQPQKLEVFSIRQNGEAIAIEDMSVEAYPADEQIPPLKWQGEALDENKRFEIKSLQLPLPGKWRLKFKIMIDDFDSEEIEYELSVK